MDHPVNTFSNLVNMESSKTNSCVSIIVAFGNDDQDLANCIESILSNEFEIDMILLNVGSIDKSNEIAEQYSAKYTNITLGNQSYDNIATARNHGIAAAGGEYLIFMNGCDSIASDSLRRLYDRAVDQQTDIVHGTLSNQMDYGTQESSESPTVDQVITEISSGPECFVSLMRDCRYVPSVHGYMYRREWLNARHLRFDENSIDPDELWVQSSLCRANTVLLTDIEFYYYKPRESTIRNVDIDGPLYAMDLLRTADRMLEFADNYSFDGRDNILKSWMYTNAMRVYASACSIVTAIRTHSVFKLPTHRMHEFKKAKIYIAPEALYYCQNYYAKAAELENEYIVWSENPCDTIIHKMSEHELSQKKIILVFNSPAWQDYAGTLQNLPSDYIITLDRTYKDQAHVVIFHMPGLSQHVYDDLEKPDHQIWVHWNMEPETKMPWIYNSGLDEIFDLRMDYHKYADVVCPYYSKFKAPEVRLNIDASTKKNKICMMISSGVNQSRREEYIAELMQYIDIDSYGRLYNNISIDGEDKGWDSKIALYEQYKFVIAFENSVLEDYVTEKLYDPLRAGAVPIYMGAPNADDYMPGDNCVINTNNFASPKELACYIKQCYADDNEYMKYHQWRQRPWRESFVQKELILDDSPFVRLCRILDSQ